MADSPIYNISFSTALLARLWHRSRLSIIKFSNISPCEGSSIFRNAFLLIKSLPSTFLARGFNTDCPLSAATLALGLRLVLSGKRHNKQHSRHNKTNVFVLAHHLFPLLPVEICTTESLHDERAVSMTSPESALLFAFASLRSFSNRSLSSTA